MYTLASENEQEHDCIGTNRRSVPRKTRDPVKIVFLAQPFTLSSCTAKESFHMFIEHMPAAGVPSRTCRLDWLERAVQSGLGSPIRCVQIVPASTTCVSRVCESSTSAQPHVHDSKPHGVLVGRPSRHSLERAPTPPDRQKRAIDEDPFLASGRTAQRSKNDGQQAGVRKGPLGSMQHRAACLDPDSANQSSWLLGEVVPSLWISLSTARNVGSDRVEIAGEIR